MEQYSSRKYINTARIALSITKNLLKEHVLLVFSKIGVNIDALDKVTCHRLGSADRTIVKWEGCCEIIGK